MTHFFTADLHIDHANIMRHTGRPFSTIDDHNEHMLAEINDIVSRNDELWILGDIFWQASRAGHWRQRVKCRKIYVLRGNHDAASIRKHVSTAEMLEIRKIEDWKVVLCHYPLESWPSKECGSIHLHGHCHGRLRTLPNRLDIGVDNAKILLERYRPFSWSEILSILQTANTKNTS